METSLSERSSIEFEVGDLLSNLEIRTIDSQDPDSIGLWWVLDDILKTLDAAKSLMPSIMAKNLGDDIAKKLKLSMKSGSKGTWCVNASGVYMVVFSLKTKKARKLQRRIADNLSSGVSGRASNKLQTIDAIQQSEIKKLTRERNEAQIEQHMATDLGEVMLDQRDHLLWLNRVVVETAQKKVAIAKDSVDSITRVFNSVYDYEADGMMSKHQETKRMAQIEARLYKQELDDIKIAFGIKKKKKNAYKEMSTMRHVMFILDRVDGTFADLTTMMEDSKYLTISKTKQDKPGYRRSFTQKMLSKLVFNNSGDIYVKHNLFNDLLGDLMSRHQLRPDQQVDLKLTDIHHVRWMERFVDLLCNDDDQGGSVELTNNQRLQKFIEKRGYQTTKEAVAGFKQKKKDIEKETEALLSELYINDKKLIVEEVSAEFERKEVEIKKTKESAIDELATTNKEIVQCQN